MTSTLVAHTLDVDHYALAVLARTTVADLTCLRNRNLLHAGGKWTRPEQLQERRPVFIVNSTRAGSDLLGSASAALSATAMVFRSADVKYSLKAANHAVQLYK
jgi:Glycosyl hydrolase family 9